LKNEHFQVYGEVFCGFCGNKWVVEINREKVKCPKCGWTGPPQPTYYDTGDEIV